MSKKSPGRHSSAPGNITLVKGTFAPSEAADVLLTLINDKIKFHSIQILNLREGSEDDIANSEERIKALRTAKAEITKMVVEARNKDLVLEINSSINIQMRPRPVDKEINH
ncbi:hypothetical protein [Lentiprolixibacter aurantiacus]|uniref:Uncharacterized protein n=1 Tax=Lentiprolixibacter aurantiacus TaxID=2993939 RepID=A0AAE3SMF9_9FLAO|nr:hypothetical protein [Lentiprolixibacter aurantiacus]MCX2718246.1 hypothetical protein [Lentiprolixibacter aurantiacus]